MTTSYYNQYIVLGGPSDGRLFPRTPDGLAAAVACGGDQVRPARRITEHDADDLRDWDDYRCDIDRGNCAAYVKP